MSNTDSTNIKIPAAVRAAVSEVLNGSHATLDELFISSGAPGPPPDMAHHSKWKAWLKRIGDDPECDSLVVLGNIIEEFMDLPPITSEGNTFWGLDLQNPLDTYKEQKNRIIKALEENGLRYFQGGRIFLNNQSIPNQNEIINSVPKKPNSVEELIEVLIKGLPRAMHPLTHRRKGATSLVFDSEYDIQDLLHSQLRPWIKDIRPEEFTPSYAGSSTRMDFLLPEHKLVIELKRIRDKRHGNKVGDELIIDIEHYRKHPDCNNLWCVIYDPQLFLTNPAGLISDLQGERNSKDGQVFVKVFVFSSD